MYSPNRCAPYRVCTTLLASIAVCLILIALPAAVRAQAVQGSADIQLTAGDQTHSQTTSVEAEPGQNIVLEVFGTGFTGALGVEAVFQLDDPSAITSDISRASAGIFSLPLPSSLKEDGTVNFTIGSFAPVAESGTDFKYLGSITLTLAPGFTTVSITMTKIDFGAGIGSAAPNVVLTATKAVALLKTFGADLDPAPGNQSQSTARVNPGRRFQAQVFGGGLRDLTAFEIHLQFDSDAIDASKTGFEALAPFQVTAAAGGAPTAPTASASPRAGADVQIGSGDGAYSPSNLSVTAQPGDVLAVEVYGTGFEASSGFEAKFQVNNPAAIALLNATPSPALFPFALSPPSLSGDTITFNLGNLAPATAGGGLQLVGTMLITLTPDYGGLALTLSSLAFLTSTTRDEVTPNAVLIAQSPDGGVGQQVSLVEVQGNTLTLKATASEPVSGDLSLGRFSFLTTPHFRGSQITFTQVVYTAGESSDTLEPNLAFTLTSVVSDAPVVTQRPVPVTVTDKRALIRWATNNPGTSKVLYGTDPATLNLEASSDDPVRTHLVLLNNLQLGTRYYFQVTSTDATNRTSDPFPFSPAAFFTSRMPDNQAPRILQGPAAFGVTLARANIVLRTDEAAQVEISYGTAEDDLSLKASSASSRLVQEVVLSGLTNGITYFYQAGVTDLNGNPGTSKVKSFKTLAAPDSRPPRILGRPSALGTSFNAAVIVFNTDEEGNTAIFYGIDSASLSETESVDESVREHQITLGNLLTDTEYSYRVASTDASGNEIRSPIFTFKTAATEDTTPPRIVRAPIVPKRSDIEALVVWGTSEPATSTVQFDTTTAIYSDDTAGETSSSSEPAKQQEIALTNLTAGKRYYYRISSTDLAGNGPTTRGSSDRMLSFATRALPDTAPPVVFSRPIALGITQNAAVINWGADEPHSAVVRFGKVAASKQAGAELTDSVEDIEFTRRHALTLSDLEASVTYAYEVETIDADNNVSVSRDLTFTTESQADNASPTIVQGPVVRNISATSATVDWITDELADSRVSYGLTADYTGLIEEATGSRFHSVTITDLQPATLYHYGVGSADQSGNIVTTDASGTVLGLSADHTFQTRAQDDAQPPVFIEGPIVEFTNEIVIVKWTSDELSSSRVAIGVVPGSAEAAEAGTPVFGQPTELVVEDNELVVDHAVTVTGLSPGKPYIFLASSTDAAGNTFSSTDPTATPKLAPPGGFGSFTTSTESDTQFPVITRGPTVVASTSSSLTVEWETDESSNSLVSFGGSQKGAAKQTTNLTSQEVSGTNVTGHRIVLTKLTAGTTYAYKAASTDATGNGATESQIGYGSTPSEVDLTAPVIQSINNKAVDSSPDEPIYKNDRSATVQWITSEASDAQVAFGTSADSLLEIRSLPDFTTEHAVTLTNLSAATPYYYRIASTDQSNNGPVQSGVLTFVTEGQPDVQAPEISEISVAAADNSVTVTWQTSELSDSAVQFGTSSGSLGFNTGDATDLTAHTVTLTNLLPSTQYFYIVESTDRSTNATQSTESTFTTLATGELQTPAAPSALLATAGNGVVKLSWADNNPATVGVSGYIVERAAGEGGFAPIATLEAMKSYIDATVQNSTAYRYQVHALGLKQVQSPASDPSESVTPEAGIGPSMPSLFVIQGNQLTPTLVVLNSTPMQPEDPLSYTFHIATSASFTDAITVGAGIASGDGTGSGDLPGLTAWTVDRTLTDGTTYHYRIKASDGTFDSAFLTGELTVDKNAPEFPGDFTGDFAVDFSDFLSLLATFNKSAGDDGFNAVVDFTGEGTVDFTDFLFFTATFNRQYVRGPSGSTKPARMPAYGIDPTSQLQLVARPTSSEAGAELAVDLTVAEVKDLKGYGIRIAYDPNIVQFQGVTDSEENLLKMDGRSAELFGTLEHDPEKGELFIAAAITSGAPVEGQGRVARLRFRLLEEAPQGDLMHIAEGLLIDGKLRVSTAEHLGARLSLVPDAFALKRNFPNPFNPETTIRYAVPEQGKVTLRIYNVLGQEVATLVNAEHLPGYYTVHWSGQDRSGRAVASGVYLYRMQAGDFTRVHKMLLLK